GAARGPRQHLRRGPALAQDGEGQEGESARVKAVRGSSSAAKCRPAGRARGPQVCRGAVMIPGIDPKVDYAFKRLFGTAHNRGLLIHLRNAVLKPPPEQRVVDLELLNPFTDKEALDDKLA